ncbi:unnamed protein product [Moneuplotes crassus]|uniref:Uncharacterized protein n=1 Tax=Euplotes crassus TaxID=5936 RepID=A0AAD1YA56_EUPCR|nr:unnamed protein product [Moneuplotes crassus]
MEEEQPSSLCGINDSSYLYYGSVFASIANQSRQTEFDKYPHIRDEQQDLNNLYEHNMFQESGSLSNSYARQEEISYLDSLINIQIKEEKKDVDAASNFPNTLSANEASFEVRDPSQSSAVTRLNKTNPITPSISHILESDDSHRFTRLNIANSESQSQPEGNQLENISQDNMNLIQAFEKPNIPLHGHKGHGRTDIIYKPLLRRLRRYFKDIFKNRNPDIVKKRYSRCSIEYLYEKMQHTLEDQIPLENITHDLVYYAIGIIGAKSALSLPCSRSTKKEIKDLQSCNLRFSGKRFEIALESENLRTLCWYFIKTVDGPDFHLLKQHLGYRDP